MKHKTKKKGHHGKHKHKHGSNTGGSTNGGDTSSVGSSPPSPTGDSSSRKTNNRGSESSHRRSMCEYCGAGSDADASSRHESFDCANDCERFTNIDIDCITSTAAFQLRSPHLTAFYCQCGALLSDIHSLIRTAGSNGVQTVFTEEAVGKIRPKLVALFASLVRLGIEPAQYTSSLSVDPEYDSEDGSSGSKDEAKGPVGPTCPFEMLLSVLLPSLHKFLEFIQLTKSLWWLTPGAAAASPLALLSAELQLHDLMTLIIMENSRLSSLMEENQERHQDLALIAQAAVLTQRRSGHSSSSSSSSSLLSYPSRPGSAKRERDDEPHRLPQVKKISFEFDEWLAECKFELAELTEAMLDTAEVVAVRLSRFPLTSGVTPSPPPASTTTSASPKTRSTANEFVELLLQHVLTPLSERVVALPSHSRSYLFPRLVERCVSITMDEYVLENGKWNEAFATQFEQAIELLRVWTTNIDAEYDKKLIAAPRDVPRLNLVCLDAFKRLELLQNTWLRHGKEGENYVPRLTFRTNLETLRSTLRRTITARSGGGDRDRGGGASAVSGNATPPPQ